MCITYCYPINMLTYRVHSPHMRETKQKPYALQKCAMLLRHNAEGDVERHQPSTFHWHNNASNSVFGFVLLCTCTWTTFAKQKCLHTPSNGSLLDQY